MRPSTLLAIESSCDDTSAAVLINGKVVSNRIANQSIHEGYGGVVPELASRAHQANIVPVVEAALKQAGIKNTELTAIAFTQGPGLLGSLLVGSSFARAYALALGIPAIPVHHMQAHVHSLFIPNKNNSIPTFPFLCMTVSGGHTQLILVKNFFNMEILGETLDDAAGEAFDKAGKMMGLSYPAGPIIDQLAKEGDPYKYKFPLSSMPGYNFSFSGIKTSILNFLKKEVSVEPNFIELYKADLCASIQHSIVKMLLEKILLACENLKISQVGIVGGVSANSYLKINLQKMGSEKGFQTFFPALEFSTDNAAMIGMSAHFALQENFISKNKSANARLEFFK